jgi:membrane protein implicated in regulation of membrane protease activity
MELLIGLVLLVLMLALVGFMVHIIVTKVPMDDLWKQLIIVACVVFAVIYLLAIVSGKVSLPTLPNL